MPAPDEALQQPRADIVRLGAWRQVPLVILGYANSRMPGRIARWSLALAGVAPLVGARPEVARAQASDDTAHTVGAYASRRGFHGYSSYLIGYRQLGREWRGARHQFVFGVGELEVSRVSWPLAAVGRVSLAYSPNVPPGSRPGSGSSGSYDVSLGLRRQLWTARDGRMRAWVGLGAAVIGASVQSKERTGDRLDATWTDHDATVGPVLELGGLRRWGPAFHAGLLGTWSRGTVRPATRPLPAGGAQVALLLGARWGKWVRGRGT